MFSVLTAVCRGKLEGWVDRVSEVLLWLWMHKQSIQSALDHFLRLIPMLCLQRVYICSECHEQLKPIMKIGCDESGLETWIVPVFHEKT